MSNFIPDPEDLTPDRMQESSSSSSSSSSSTAKRLGIYLRLPNLKRPGRYDIVFLPEDVFRTFKASFSLFTVKNLVDENERIEDMLKPEMPLSQVREEDIDVDTFKERDQKVLRHAITIVQRILLFDYDGWVIKPVQPGTKVENLSLAATTRRELDKLSPAQLVELAYIADMTDNDLLARATAYQIAERFRRFLEEKEPAKDPIMAYAEFLQLKKF